MIDGANTMVVSFAVFIMMLIVATIVFKTPSIILKKLEILKLENIFLILIEIYFFKKDI